MGGKFKLSELALGTKPDWICTRDHWSWRFYRGEVTGVESCSKVLMALYNVAWCKYNESEFTAPLKRLCVLRKLSLTRLHKANC